MIFLLYSQFAKINIKPSFLHKAVSIFNRSRKKLFYFNLEIQIFYGKHLTHFPISSNFFAQQKFPFPPFFPHFPPLFCCAYGFQIWKSYVYLHLWKIFDKKISSVRPEIPEKVKNACTLRQNAREGFIFPP